MGWFSKKKIELTPQWQKDLQQELAKGEGYGGKFAAPMSEHEKTGMGRLGEYLKEPATGESFALGQEELKKTLTGEGYDPLTSPYYGAYKTAAMTNLEDVIDQIRGQKAAGGEFFTSERIGAEQKAGRGVAENLNMVLGDLFEKERARRFSALPIAMQYDEYATHTAPLKKVSAATTFGALPRMIEQRELEGKYQDFVRTKNQQLTMAGMQIQPDVYTPSGFEQTIDTAIRAVSAIQGGGGQKSPGIEQSIAGRSGGAGGGGTDFSSYLSGGKSTSGYKLPNPYRN